MLLASHAGTSPASLAALEMWAPAGPVEGLQLLASPAGSNPAVKAYALRCIANTKPEKVRSGEGGWGGWGGITVRYIPLGALSLSLHPFVSTPSPSLPRPSAVTQIVSYLPQLVQTLLHDSSGNIQRTLLATPLLSRTTLYISLVPLPPCRLADCVVLAPARANTAS